MLWKVGERQPNRWLLYATNFPVIFLGVSRGLAAILIVAAVIAVKRNSRPPQVRQLPNVPAASVKQR